jgi:hypothetical protein
MRATRKAVRSAMLRERVVAAVTFAVLTATLRSAIRK